MEKQMEEGKSGVRVYTPSVTPPKPEPSSSSASTEKPGLVRLDKNQGGKRKMIANGVQKTLNKTSLLGNFLPTGTLLAFEMVLPTIYRTGECSHVTKLMMNLLLILCTLSCFFFHFTDSFKCRDDKVFYGFVTPNGLAVFKPDLGMVVPQDDKYKLSFNDLVHAVMSVMVFVSIAFSDNRVTNVFVSWEGEGDVRGYGELSLDGWVALQWLVSHLSNHPTWDRLYGNLMND